MSAQRIAVETKCARCGRLWYADYDKTKDMPVCSSFQASLAIGALTRTIEYDALCDVCLRAVVGYLDNIDKLQKASPNRKPTGKKKGATSAPSP